jgi:hypothetical protein
VRFYQGEWLARLPRRTGWERLFRGGWTPVVNPGSAVVVESKRFPLVWDALRTRLPTWRMLLPETRDPRDAPWRADDDDGGGGGWLLKSAFCNTGDQVCAPGWVDVRHWRSAAREARWFPWNWAAQRRFDAVPLETPDGPMFPCLGVYTVNGRAAGIYGRLSRGPVVDYAAVDVAVLLTRHGGSRGGLQ